MIAMMEVEGGRDGAETTEELGEVMAGGETVGGTKVAGAMAGDASAHDAMVDDEAVGTAMLGPGTSGLTREAATATRMRRGHRGKRTNWQPKPGRKNSRPIPRPLLLLFEPLFAGRMETKLGDARCTEDEK